jgi:hypothetical protein
VWPLSVEVVDVDAEDILELAATEDQELIEALPTHAADPVFGERVCVRRPDRCADDGDVFALEDAVEDAAELRVAIVDQEARPLAAGEEITSEDRLSVLAEERAPAELVALRRRRDAGAGEPLRTRVAETVIPSLRNSPTIRT